MSFLFFLRYFFFYRQWNILVPPIWQVTWWPLPFLGFPSLLLFCLDQLYRDGWFVFCFCQSGSVVTCVLHPSCLGLFLDGDLSHVEVDLRVIVLEPRESENDVLRSDVRDHESNEDRGVLEARSDPGVMHDFSGLVKSTVNIAGDDGRVELVKFDVVFLGIGSVHENSSCSSVKEDWGFDNFIFFCGFAFNKQSDVH